jgi:cobyrinic acid a,c-diamide synthase
VNSIDCPALMIAGIASGQGKTSVTAALARAHRRLGRRVRVFKTGPDFIDPMVLERASGQPVWNLDDRMVGIDHSRHLLREAASHSDLILVEGAMGLFDGPPSSADLAAALGLPVIVVIDAAAMAQTFGALAQGLADKAARHGVRVLGAVANRVAGADHAALLAGSLRPPLRLWAALPRVAATMPERHLGLASEDSVALDAAIDALADALAADASADAAPLALPPPARFAAVPAPDCEALLQGLHVAVARDAAFRFIYPANLALLEQLGATLSFFSPLADEPPADSADAMWLPGGYPELFAETLSLCSVWPDALRRHVRAGKPVLAECGGLMALAETLVTLDGAEHALVGALRGRAVMQPRVQSLGVQSLHGVARKGERPSTEPLRGHTYHHSRFDTDLPALLQCRRLDGSAGEPVWRVGRLTASFFHAYFPSSPHAVAALFDPRAKGAVCHC